ncbi:MAG: hypothetical protein ACXW61_13800 [Gemmatirosa sp.]
MTGPIGRAGAAGGVGPVGDGDREGTRQEARASSREGGARGTHDAGDRVTISPEALRGAWGGGDEQSGDGRGEPGTDAREAATAAGASGFRNAGEALLVARGLANALRQDPARAARVHDLVSPARTLSLLRS